MQNQTDEIINEGFWWSKHHPHLPKVKAGKPFTDQGVLTRLLFLLQKRLVSDYLVKLKEYEAAYQVWRERTPLKDRIDNVGEPLYPGYGEVHPSVQVYRGWSSCRICGERNGHREFTFGGYCWPEGYLHYIQEHNVEPSEGFKKMLGGAALWMAHPEVRFAIENGVDGNVACVQRMVSGERLVALHISTRCKHPRVTALGSDHTDDKDVSIVYIDTLGKTEEDDGGDTGIMLTEYPGWTVWSAQAVKYGVNVCLLAPDALLFNENDNEDSSNV